MKAGEFAKWSATDDEGSFSHVGLIKSVNNAWTTIITKDGEMSFRLQDGTLEPHAAVDLKVKLEKVIEKAEKTTTPSVKRTGTKLEGAIEIVKANVNASRKDLIELFCTQLGMTPAGASTYVNTARKAVTELSK